MISRLFLWGLLFSFVKGSDADQDSLKSGLQFYLWKTVTVDLVQYQYGQTFSEEISISFIDSNSYLIGSSQQDIFVSGSIIKTLNRQTDQLIIDQRLVDNGDVFSLLNGNIDQLTLENRRNEKGLITFDISMVEIGISSTVTVKENSWHFHSMTLNYDEENWIKISEKSWQILRGVYSFENFGSSSKEVIDLRE